MTYTTCSTCGALSAPWSLGHAPHCPDYQPTRSTRLCEVCGYPAAVERIDHGEYVAVTFACRRGCEVSWVETTDPDDEDDDEHDDDPGGGSPS